MKNPKNIEALNALVMHYISLHGLQGIALEQDNPFTIYFTNMLMGSLFPNGNLGSNLSGTPGGAMLFSIGNDKQSMKKTPIPNYIVHLMIKKAYEFYQTIDELDNVVDPIMKEQISYQLGDIKYDDFFESSIDVYKTSLFSIVNNYNSNKIEYNKIKIELFKDKMKEYVEIENYELAAEIRDKISELKDKI